MKKSQIFTLDSKTVLIMKAIADVHFVESLFPEGCFIELFMIEKRDYRNKDDRISTICISAKRIHTNPAMTIPLVAVGGTFKFCPGAHSVATTEIF